MILTLSFLLPILSRILFHRLQYFQGSLIWLFQILALAKNLQDRYVDFYLAYLIKFIMIDYDLNLQFLVILIVNLILNFTFASFYHYSISNFFSETISTLLTPYNKTRITHTLRATY